MNSEKKHIVFLPRWYPNRYDSMWGLFVKKHAESASLYNNVTVFFLEAKDEGLVKTEIIHEKSGSINTLNIYYPKPRYLFLYLIKFIRLFLLGMKMINKQNKIDLVHVHILSRMGFLAALYQLIHTTPFLITEHWSRYQPTVNGFNGKLRIFLTKKTINRSKAILPVTKNLQEAMESHGLNSEHYQIVPNVVDDLFFKYNIKKNTDPIIRFIHVSTFEDKSKNISGIIKGINKLLKSRRDFNLSFIGDGEDFIAMKSLVEQLNISTEYIEFLGLLEKEDLVKEYMKADFMLINSNYENMPVVINEAFACGLPVLSTNVGGISEHLNNERGRLMPTKDADAFLENLEWMLKNCRDYKGEEIRTYANHNFSYSAVGKQLDKIYQNI